MKTEGYDMIGDIHGKAAALKRLLESLGYIKTNGCFRNPNRQAIFLGDFVDRGPGIPETLAIVKAMMDEGAARAVLGNHEYNLLRFYTRDSQGEPLLDHRQKNLNQVAETTKYFDADPEAKELYLDWMKDLPLFLDLGPVRVVHACWNPDSIDALKGATTLRECGLGRDWERKSPVGEAVATLTKGMEIKLEKQYTFPDRSGILRREMRTRWWRTRPGTTYPELALPGPGEFPPGPVPVNELSTLPGYPAGAPPLFLGHYGFGTPPGLMAPNVACVDYSTNDGQTIGAYRWNGEECLIESNLLVPEKEFGEVETRAGGQS